MDKLKFEHTGISIFEVSKRQVTILKKINELVDRSNEQTEVIKEMIIKLNKMEDK